MIHSRYVKPRVFPWSNDRDPEQIDRSQEIGGDLTLNREKTYEIGRDGVLSYNKGIPSFAYTMRQYEYGSMAFFRALANKEDPLSGGLDESVTLDDLKSTKIDIAAFLTDDNATFSGTIWFPKLRVNGFGINIGDPEAIIERNFDLIGEDYKILDEKYFSFEKKTASIATEIVALDPAPIEYASGEYIFRVLRVRSGVVSELEKGTGANQWSYAAGDVTVNDCVATDLLKIYYPSATAYTTTWTNNDSDPDFLKAEYCEIFMKVGTAGKIYRLQSLGIDVAFERADYRELGNSEVVQTGVKNKTVTIALDRFSENFALEDIFAGDPAYPFINPRDFVDNIQVQVLVYGEKEHTNFKIGYLMTGVSPTAIGTTQAVEDYNKRTASLECDNLKISDDASELVFA